MILSAIRLGQKSDVSAAEWLLFGLLATLGLYTKLSILLLLPLPALALWRSPRCLMPLASLYLFIVAATLPVWLRNLHEFGALLPLTAGFGTPAWRVPGPASAAFAFRSFIFPWWEFWRSAVGLLFMAPLSLFLLDAVFRRGDPRRASRRLRSLPPLWALPWRRSSG